MLASRIALQNNENHLRCLPSPKNIIIPQNIITETHSYERKTDCSLVNP